MFYPVRVRMVLERLARPPHCHMRQPDRCVLGYRRQPCGREQPIRTHLLLVVYTISSQPAAKIWCDFVKSAWRMQAHWLRLGGVRELALLRSSWWCIGSAEL